MLAGTILFLLATTTVFVQNNKASSNSVKTRPIQDFLSSQVVNSFFLPGLPSVGWGDPVSGRTAWVDYAGATNQYLVNNGGTSLGTQTDGTVTERPLADGTALVTVVLHTTNALVYAVDINGNTLFGNAPNDVVANSPAGVGKCLLFVEFINSAPGAPLPDLATIINVRFIAITSTATGPLSANFGVPNGTPGSFQMTQTGVVQYHGCGGPRGAFFPAEHINLTVAPH